MSKVAFLFPGQGAQSVGMGQATAAELPAARDLFDQANEILGYKLDEVCFHGPADKLNSTVHSQPGLLVCSLAALEKLKAETPDVVAAASIAAGLSLGEYTALVFADAISFGDAVRVVQCRGEAMQAASDAHASGMVSVLGLETKAIKTLCEEARQPNEVLQVANHLCPGNVVCSGHQASCVELAERANAAGAMKVIPLAVAGAFHTSLMQPALDRLADTLQSIEIREPRIPVISNVDTQAHSDPEEIREILVKQVINPVQWEASCQKMMQLGVDEFYEIGPGKVLRGLLRRMNRKIACTNVN